MVRHSFLKIKRTNQIEEIFVFPPAKQYLEDALALEENSTIGSVEEKEIAGHKFYCAEMQYEVDEENTYYMKDYVYDNGDNFVCIIFQTLNNEKTGLEDMLVTE